MMRIEVGCGGLEVVNGGWWLMMMLLLLMYGGYGDLVEMIGIDGYGSDLFESDFGLVMEVQGLW
jgi:hypothetical protein